MRTVLNLKMIGRGIAILLGIYFLVAPSLLAKREDDVVIMKNGDRITGEIKRLESGILYFKPAYALDTIALDWLEVEQLESQDYYSVDLTNGQRLTGAIEAGTKPDQKEQFVKVKPKGGTTDEISRPVVMKFQPEEDHFLKRLDGSIDYGFSYAQGNNQTQSTLSAGVDYQSSNYKFHADGSSIVSRQSDGTSTKRHSLNLTASRYLTRSWYVGALGSLLSSDQQQLNLRTTLGAGVGRDLFRTFRTNLSVVGGAGFTNEHYEPGLGREPRVNNAEALIGLTFKTRKFDKSQLESRTYFFPNLTTGGRYRLNSTANWKLDLVGDLYWSLSVYESFDSKPPIEAPRNDVGVSTSLGYSF